MIKVIRLKVMDPLDLSVANKNYIENNSMNKYKKLKLK